MKIPQDVLDYTNGESAPAIEQIPDDCADAISQALEEMGWEDLGVDCTVVATHQPLADFEAARASHWTECKNHEALNLGGRNAHAYYGVQLTRGGQRHNFIVIDCGELRITLQ